MIEEAIIKALNDYFEIESILLRKNMGEDVSIRHSIAFGLPEEILDKLLK